MSSGGGDSDKQGWQGWDGRTEMAGEGWDGRAGMAGMAGHGWQSREVGSPGAVGCRGCSTQGQSPVLFLSLEILSTIQSVVPLNNSCFFSV